MLIRKPADLRYSDVTPKNVYVNRRRFLAAGSAIVGAWALPTPAGATMKLNNVVKSTYKVDEKITPKEDITSYNNYYEFGTGKDEPSRYANTLRPSPWQVQVGGMVDKPKTYDLDFVMKIAPLEERIYRHRCVEACSIVVPWIGFPLAALLRKVEPTSQAKFVEFATLHDPEQFPGQRKGLLSFSGLDWPYVEGLRVDEAMHPLTLLTVGMYGHVLPNQNGAPVRVVIPWKYGFKSAKSLVRIRLVSEQPKVAWEKAAPQEYGFYSNVNPTVDHPRWSQATERRIGEFRRRKTLMFNGYADQVSSLYTGLDLRKNY